MKKQNKNLYEYRIIEHNPGSAELRGCREYKAQRKSTNWWHQIHGWSDLDYGDWAKHGSPRLMLNATLERHQELIDWDREQIELW